MKFKERLQKNIAVLKNMLDYARTRDLEMYEIPEAHQNLVMEWFKSQGKILRCFWNGM
jgi:hypothetical protein